MAELQVSLRTYRALIGARVRADWQYRTSFLLFLAGQVIASGLDLAAIALFFASVDSLAGWSGAEVGFLFGMTGVGYGIADLFVSPVDRVALHVKAGTFDTFLVRPIGPLWQVLAHEFAARRVGRAAQPLAALVVTAPRVGVDWGPAEAALLALAIASGAALFSAIWVVTSSIAFFTTETQEIANSFTDGGRLLAGYPLDVMGAWLRRAATFVVPLASIAYLPAAWLVGKPMPFGLPRAAGWSGPFVALAAALVARAAWGLAIRHYRSTGS